MANMTVTNVDLGSLILDRAEFRDELLAFPGADTYVEGTILARRQVATAVTASAVTGGGTGTVTAASVVEGPIVPLVGAYVLTCITAVANGGVWQLKDPNGAIVSGNLVMTVGAGAATVFEAGGLVFTITDGGTDFSAGATATLTVAADGDLVVYNPAGVGGAQIPLAVLPYEVVATGAADVPVRALVSGVVRKDKLVIDAGGSITNTVIDALRHFGIVALDSVELNILDNQ